MFALRRFAPAGAVATAFALAASVSWRRLGSLLVDTGRELEVPRRLAAGEVLYDPVRYYWGPLAPYLNAGLYSLTGVTSDVLMAAGIASAAVMAAGLYVLGRGFLGPWSSSALAATFVFMSGFPQLGMVAVFNFVLPFNFSATYGIVAATWCLVLLLAHTRRAGDMAFAGSAALLGVTALAKLEAFLPAAAAHLAFALASRSRLRVLHTAAWAGSAATVFSAYALLAARAGGSPWSQGAGSLLNGASLHYLLQSAGLLEPGEALASIALSLAALAATLGGALAVTRLAEARGLSSRGLVAAAAATFAAAFALYASLDLSIAYRALTVILPAGAAVAAWRLARAGVAESERLPTLLLWVFGLACIARIPLRAAPTHYGFFLLPPGLACLAVLVAVHAPDLLGGRCARTLFATAAAGMLLGGAVAALRVSWTWYRLPRQEIATPRCHLQVLPDTHEAPLVDLLRQLPPQSTVVAVPEGAGLVFASGLRPADGMTSYLPMEVPGAREEARILASWAASPPDFVLWWRRDLSGDFGVPEFGVGYATGLAAWIRDHYRPVTDPSNPFVLLGRASP